MDARKPRLDFSGKWWFTDREFGYVEIGYSHNRLNAADAEVGGLWLTVAESNGKGEHCSHALRFKYPPTELLRTAALAALGFMPLPVFADWFEERADELLPLLDVFDPPWNAADEFRQVVAALRRPFHLP